MKLGVSNTIPNIVNLPGQGGGGGSSFENTKSMIFDGVDDYVDCGTITTLNGLSEASWSCWIKIGAGETTNQNVFGQDAVGGNNGIRVFFNPSGRCDIYLSLLRYRVTGNAVVTGLFDQNWHNITITFNKDNSPSTTICALYIDGVAVPNAWSASNAVLPTLTQPFDIGRWQNNLNNFGGNIDEFGIWNTELDEDDVTELFNNGTPTDLATHTKSADLKHWYRMGDNSTFKEPQILMPENSNKDKVSNFSMEFDGINDYVDTGILSIDGVNKATFSCWFKTSNTNWQYLYGAGADIRFQYKQNLNRLDLRFNNSVVYRTTGVGITAGVWHNIIITFDGTLAQADRIKVYTNGGTPLINSLSGTPDTTIDLPSAFRIGRGGTYSAKFWFGNIDEFSIWDIALDQAQVIELYYDGEPTDLSSHSGAANLVNWWRMGEDATFVYNVNPDGTWTIPDPVGSNDGISNNIMVDTAREGDAPKSSNNAVSFNMDAADVVPDPAEVLP